MKYAIVRDNIVENLIEWDGASDWEPPDGTTAAKAPMVVSMGWIWNDGSPFDPTPKKVDPPAPTLTPQKKLAALGITVAELKTLLA